MDVSFPPYDGCLLEIIFVEDICIHLPTCIICKQVICWTFSEVDVIFLSPHSSHNQGEIGDLPDVLE